MRMTVVLITITRCCSFCTELFDCQVILCIIYILDLNLVQNRTANFVLSENMLSIMYIVNNTKDSLHETCSKYLLTRSTRYTLH